MGTFLDDSITAAWRELDQALSAFDGSEEAYARIEYARRNFPNLEPDGEAQWSVEGKETPCGYSNCYSDLAAFVGGY